MSLPANLFVDTPEMEDVSLHQLGNDTEAWPEEIITKVRERLPRSGGLQPVVKFMKKDDENGTATGSVSVSSGDKSAIIPLIIKDFMMFPLDVFISSGKLLPLNPDYFDAAFSKNELFDKIEEYPTFGGLGRFEDANLWNAIYPPSLGRYAYAASTAGFPIVNALEGTIDGSELAAFLQNSQNAKTAAKLLSGPFRDEIKKLANLRPVNMNEFRQGVDNLIPRSIVMLRRDNPNKYSILSNSDTVFHPGVVHMDRSMVMDTLSELSDHAEDDINDVDQNGEKFLVLPTPKNDVILAKEDTETPEEAKEFDHYVVKTKTGVSVEGIVVPTVVDFTQKKVDIKLFLGKTMSSMQPTIWGVRMKNSRFKPPCQHPKVGQTGTFLYQPDASHGLATVPVTISSVAEDCGQLCVRAHDLMGRGLKLTLQQHAGPGALQRIAMDGNASYIIPASMRWVPMEDMSEVTNSADDYAVKTAGARKTDWPVSVIPTGHGQFAMRGVDKYASALGWDKGMLSPGQVAFILVSLGAPQEKIAKAFKHASAYGRAEFHGLNKVPLASEKIALARPVAAHLVKVAKSLRRNLFKEAAELQVFVKKASYLENSQTVDALLSLNFVNPTNVAKYISKLPALKSAISHLASCLIASRLGMKEIPELSASTAMARLVEVVDGLEKLKATQEVAAQQG